MFDHLDDPIPFEPDARLHDAVVRRGRRLRHRRRLAVGSVASAGLAVAGVANAGLRLDRQLDDVQHVEVASLPPDEAPPLAEPTTLLLVGSDAGVVSPATGEAEIDRRRADSILLVRIDPDRDAVVLLPLPRDLWLDAPGRGPMRLAAIFEVGGPELLVATIRDGLGISVDRYAEAGFDGATAIADAIGGLRLSFDLSVRDRMTGLELAPGCHTLGGDELLALGRSRHLEQLVGDRWEPDPTSDLGRIERQQALASAMVVALADLDARRPGELLRLADEVVDHLVVDQRTSGRDLTAMVRAMQEADSVASVRLPVTDAVIDGAAVLELGDASWTLDAFRRAHVDGTAPVADPGVWVGSPAAVVPVPC